MKLHYSQTNFRCSLYTNLFDSPMKLHYSQTGEFVDKIIVQFDSPMKLHYSQTAAESELEALSLIPL